MHPSERNLVITGFMGSGKTTVGRALAERLQRPFVDIDHWIEAREGCSIVDIFKREGEVGFRRLEQEAAATLAERRGEVIATGGGTLISEANRRPLSSSGLLITLWLPFDQIVKRLKAEDPTMRPLLGDSVDENRLRDLFESRRRIYLESPVVIDASGTVDKVVEQLLTAIGEERWREPD